MKKAIIGKKVGRQKSAKAIAGQAAKNALRSVARSGSNAIIRGLFGTKK